MPKHLDQEIISAWKQNAQAWIQAIENQSISSRTLITNQAIIDAVLDQKPGHVWDLGCGEGWLADLLEQKGINTLGTDVVPQLINKAREKGGGRFEVLAYEDIQDFQYSDSFDVIVCNFSLLGKESVAQVLEHSVSFLSEKGKLIIQSLHPDSLIDEQGREEYWRMESWEGFEEKFSAPSLWYYRSMDAWKRLFQRHHWKLLEIREPMHPHRGKPASVIFMLSL